MLQFNIGGKVLETGAIDLSFKRTNNIFTFGDVELTRSVSFKVPATAHNDAIFSLAKDYHLSGSQARLRLEAQMQYEGGMDNGYLYIDKCTGKAYDCVFVSGRHSGLIAMKDAGKIADNYVYTTQDNTAIDLEQTSIKAPSSSTYTFDIVRYYSSYYNSLSEFSPAKILRNPSIRLYDLLKDINTLFDVTIVNHSDFPLNALRLVLCKVKTIQGGEVNWQKIADGEEQRSVRLKDNMPDYTYWDLLKIIANLSGMYIQAVGNEVHFYIRDSEGYIYGRDVTEEVPAWDVIHIKNVTAVSEVGRGFKSFKQHNIIGFDINDGDDALAIDYAINNKLLEYTQDVMRFKFSDGQSVNGESAQFKDCDIQDIWRGVGTNMQNWHDKSTIALEVSGRTYLSYINTTIPQTQYTFSKFMTEQADMVNLAYHSTQIKMTAVMSLLEFNALRDGTFIVYDGCKWVWTEAQWSKGKVTLTLNKWDYAES